MPVAIRVNGQKKNLETKITISDLLKELNIPVQSVVVERNLEILHRESFDQVVLDDGDELELIRFVGGG
jgi:thiamine biosynthesis protein ThiS